MGFFDGGNKSLSFGDVNTTTWFQVVQGGVILHIGDERQATSVTDGTPRTFKSGDPIMQVPITLDTRAGAYPAAAVDADDDGIRDFYVAKGSGQIRAIGKALRDAGVKDLEVGGTLYIQWVSGIGKIGDPRVFVAQYFPPAAGGGMFAAEAAPVATPAPAAAPSFPPQVPAAARTNPDTGQPIAARQPSSYDPATGQPIYAETPAAQAQPRFDPNTGQPIAAPVPAAAPVQTVVGYNPQTGAPIYGQPAAPAPQQSFPGQVVPAAGQPMPGAQQPQPPVTNPFLAR